MNKKLLVTGSIFGALAVMLGAFAAHGLKALIAPEQIETFQTGVRYQMYHALFLLFIGCTNLASEKAKRLVLWITVFGVLFFSGSVYALATNDLTSFDFKTIGFITPIGGLLLIISWIIMLLNFFKKSRE